jgi:Mg-chelatase subunit ChlD
VIKRLIIGFVAIVLVLAARPVAVLAQQPAAAVTINQVDATNYPDMRAVVTAVDAGGVPVPDLTATQLQAFDGDTSIPITAVQPGQDGSQRLSVVVAIDVSGSMAGDPLDRAKQAATAFVQSLGANDTASVVAFNATVTTIVPFTSDKPQLVSGIASLQAGGGTALYEAVLDTSYLAGTSGSPRRAVILLTDGENDAPNSTTTADGSLDVAKSVGAPLFTIGFGETPDLGYLQGLASATHGSYRGASAANIGAVYDDLARLLRNQYVLTLKASGRADGARTSLRVVATIGGAPIAATAPFTRGNAPVVVAPAPTAIPTAVASAPAPAASSSSTNAGVIVAAIVAAVVLAGLALLTLTLLRRRRNQRAIDAIVAPNPDRAARQGVPAPDSQTTATAVGVTGRLLPAGSDATSSIVFGATPITIGSQPTCDIVLEPAPDVAPRHAQLWMRDGKMTLRHLGGGRRATTIAGRRIDWVILEDGDEFAVGPHRYRAERVPGPATSAGS